MNKESELIKNGLYYEMFMERAYGTYESPKPGMQAYVMQNLIIAEKGQVISVESIGHFEEQLAEIKKYMENAIDNYMAKRNVTQELIDTLKEYKNEIVWVVNSDELMKIVFKTIDVTASITIDMQ